MVLARKGNIIVELEDIGEGLDGNYNPEDPKDIPLLRFSVYSIDELEEWHEFGDASYCTQIPVDTPQEKLQDLANLILEEVYEPASSGYSIKKICERLSWLSKNSEGLPEIGVWKV